MLWRNAQACKVPPSPGSSLFVLEGGTPGSYRPRLQHPSKEWQHLPGRKMEPIRLFFQRCFPGPSQAGELLPGRSTHAPCYYDPRYPLQNFFRLQLYRLLNPVLGFEEGWLKYLPHCVRASTCQATQTKFACPAN